MAVGAVERRSSARPMLYPGATRRERERERERRERERRESEIPRDSLAPPASKFLWAPDSRRRCPRNDRILVTLPECVLYHREHTVLECVLCDREHTVLECILCGR
jgi:hypothetical protein